MHASPVILLQKEKSEEGVETRSANCYTLTFER